MNSGNETIISKIHTIQLECLAELDRICKEEGLEYTMIYGTMLGAVRHKGFIPWDDDVDVCMPYEDMMKLSGKLDDKYFFQTRLSDPEVPFVFGKIRRNGTKMPEKPLENLNMHQGIWIDIFPYINAPTNKILKRIQFLLLQVAQSIRCRALNKQTKKNTLLVRLPYRVVLQMEETILKLLQRIGSKHSKEYLILDNDTFASAYIEKHFLDHKKEYEFEGCNIMGVSAYHQYLVRYYGENYMIPLRWGHVEDYSAVVFDR